MLPGFIDTHRHMWQAALRGVGADMTLEGYFSRVAGDLAAQFTPDDVHLGQALSAYAALDAGVTTVQDVANIHAPPNTPTPPSRPCAPPGCARSWPTAIPSPPGAPTASPPTASHATPPGCGPSSSTTRPW
ncbi:amidohydrolase family protein [Streptomyces sp. AV19]|uniref:amidohydrolase family protein n=1 Tax=Streptomyces sp. AV19 TaxID=2793068 RepID=UPI0018FE6A37|nr:amidohydrolase family protein [Streptomyces sp. AV19]MBH1934323.1 amidohydrolase family protein [Streptomyces sp. AV19]MDG4533369.1 amidohydrolase family protein [Streptomyces sp. AV19]